MVAGGLVPPHGVQPLELVARDPGAYQAMIAGLGAHGVKLDRRAL